MKQPYVSEVEVNTLSPGAVKKKTAVEVGQEVLMRKAFEQDPRQGCALLFRRYYGNLCNYAIRYVYAKDIAEEIVAEVFANFWQNRAYEHITVSYQAYLYRAVQYRSYNYLRQELRRMAPLEAAAFTLDKSTPADELLHYHELSLKVDRLIQQLPPQSRRAFQLNRLEGKKYHEIATELGVSVSAVERLISRALSKLRHELRNEWLLALVLL